MYIPTPNESQFENPPAGTHMAICYRVIDLGTQETTWNGKPKHQHKILIGWELPEEKMTDGRPFTINQRYTWSMSEKASLRKDLEGWRGTPFTEKDFGSDGFDIKNIVGKPCLLTIIHESKNGKTYANISSVSRLMKGMTAPQNIANETAYLWLHEDRWDSTVFHKLSDNLQSIIMKSPEYKTMVNGDTMPSHIVDAEPDFHNDPIPF